MHCIFFAVVVCQPRFWLLHLVGVFVVVWPNNCCCRAAKNKRHNYRRCQRLVALTYAVQLTHTHTEAHARTLTQTALSRFSSFEPAKQLHKKSSKYSKSVCVESASSKSARSCCSWHGLMRALRWPLVTSSIVKGNRGSADRSRMRIRLVSVAIWSCYHCVCVRLICAAGQPWPKCVLTSILYDSQIEA